jgi:hypothetical protein
VIVPVAQRISGGVSRHAIGGVAAQSERATGVGMIGLFWLALIVIGLTIAC